MAQIDDILRSAVERGASDIHFSSDESSWMRVDGDLERFGDKIYSPMELETLLFEILTETERTRLQKVKNIDRSYTVEGAGNFRVNVFYTRKGIGAVIRTLPARMPSIDDLGLPEIVKSLAAAPKGLILVTGPTGSGKSTTLAAIIDYMNQNFGYHILTAEDPVEFVHQSKKSLINQREIGLSCPTFADALKYALREDPDVILVGELRDFETMSLAMTAAETGHLVLATLHTRGAASTMDRIIESFPSVQQAQARAMLSESLQAVISQTLLKRPDGPGRVAVYEVMVMNYAISNLVREGKTFQVTSIMQTGRKEGMMTMETHARELLAEGRISKEDADDLIASMARGTKVVQPAGAPAAPASAPARPASPGFAPGTLPTMPPKVAQPPAMKAPQAAASAAPAPAPAPPPMAAKPVVKPVVKAPASPPPVAQAPAAAPVNLMQPTELPRPAPLAARPLKPAKVEPEIDIPEPIDDPMDDLDFEIERTRGSADSDSAPADDTGYTNLSDLRDVAENLQPIPAPVAKAPPPARPAPKPSPAPTGKAGARPLPIPTKKAG